MRLSLFFTFLFALIFLMAGGYAYLAGDPRALLLCVVLFALCAGISHVLLRPLDEIANAVEGLTRGETDTQLSSVSSFGAETSRLATATNKLARELHDLHEAASNLASGSLDVIAVETGVLRSGDLSNADQPVKSGDHPTQRELTRIQNQMRRLTIQARLVAEDQISHEILDAKVDGELGEGFFRLVENLREVSERAQMLAEGNLAAADAKGEGDLRGAVHQIAVRSRDLVSRITDTALHISAATGEISAVLREQEYAASHQASSVEETQRTMETLLSSAKKIAESAQTVFKSAERTQANNRTVADRIGELKSHTERISEILEVIKSIADRSDLLALNASLEGMRAGEAGKGFTLVAAEMRRLAENIKESVSDIKELLVDIRESALSSVMATEEGTNLSDRTTESALKITLITQQQQSGTEQVTQSMDELSTLINQGVAGTRQLTTASSELVQMSDELRELVERFRNPHASEAEKPSPRPARSKPRAKVQTVTRELGSNKKSDSRSSKKDDESKKSDLRDTRQLVSPRGEDPPTVEFSSAFGNSTDQEPDTPSLQAAEENTRSIDQHIDALEASLNEPSDSEET